MKPILTIFTPTYNRAYILPKLYESLIRQSNKNFIWLIVDDGSNDNTQEIIKKWKKDNYIKIEYIKQHNQGKHIAHNIGVDNCKTDLFFCVDSDDYLLDNAVEDIYRDYYNIEDNNISGIVSIKMTEMREAVGTNMPIGIKYSSLSDLYEKYKFKGDTALVFKTDILKTYKFPKINGEKFVGEEYIYSQIDEHYKLYISRYKYYVCEYLDDGYTKNIFRTIVRNPKGYMILKKTKLQVSRRIIVKYKNAALYVVGCWLSREKDMIKKSPSKLITILSIPLAICIYIIRFKNIVEEEKLDG